MMNRASAIELFKISNYEQEKNRNPLREPGTCEWVLHNQRYQAWHASDKDDLIWISADPGCGKSVLARSLIDTDLVMQRSPALQTRNEPADPIVCYYFFKDNGSQDSLSTGLCAILHQLFTQMPQLISHAIPVWKRLGAEIQKDSAELWSILIAATRDMEVASAICVFDALDECRNTDRKQLIRCLRDFYKQTVRENRRDSTLKFFVTSRPYADIEQEFKATRNESPIIRLRGEDENDQIHREIDTVICSQVKVLAEELDLQASTEKRLRDQLLSMNHRTYLWLHLAIDSVRETFDSLRPDEKLIETLPVSVDMAYEQMLSRIPQSLKKTVRSIFLLIVGASRPLTVGEAAIALDIATASQAPMSLKDLEIEHQGLKDKIRRWCRLFVFISHDKLYLIHQTAKEFILSSSELVQSGSGAWKHYLTPLTLDIELSRIYMTFLCLKEFDEKWCSLDLILDRDWPRHWLEWVTAEERFFDIAAANWVYHWSRVETLSKVNPPRQLQMLYDMKSIRSSRCRRVTHYPDLTFNDDYKSIIPSPLRFAALYGHMVTLEKIIQNGSENIECTDQRGWTATMLAARMGHLSVMQLLHKHGAQLTRCVDYNSAPDLEPAELVYDALSAASYGGHKGVAHYLIEYGVSDLSWALRAAAISGSTAITRLLLDNGADANSRYQTSSITGSKTISDLSHDLVANTPIQIATCYGHTEVVGLLIKHGAKVNMINSGDTSALQIASHLCSYEMVELLIENGADINHTGGQYSTALQAASSGGGYKIVKLLLEHGAKVNIVDDKFGTALYAASCNRDPKTVELLLSHRADPNIIGGKYRTALQAAACWNRGEIVVLLLKCGAEVNLITDGLLATALQVAAYFRNPEIVELLIRNGADVNIIGGEYGTALHGASCRGSKQLVEQLIHLGADMNIVCGKYGTPLHAACVWGNTRLLKFYIQHGIPINLSTENCGTPLQLACEWTRKDIVEILLDLGADVNYRTTRVQSPLRIARNKLKTRMSRSNLVAVDEIISMLLYHGAKEEDG